MDSVFVQLVPIALGAALSPLYIIVVLLMLSSPRGLVKAAAFVGGLILGRIIQGVLFGFIFNSSPDNTAENGGPSPVVSTLVLMVGILMLIAAYRTWRKEADPDDPPPSWMQSIDTKSPLQALRLGLMLVVIGAKYWVFIGSALGVITAASLSAGEKISAFLIFVLMTKLLLVVPILGSVLAPKPAASILRRMTAWLTRHSRPITLAVKLLFGVYFTWNGVSGLLT